MVQPKRKVTWSWVRWLVLLPIPVLWSLLSHYGKLEFFENRTVDWRFSHRGELPPPLKIVYVDVDDRSIEDIGNMPWNRSYFARVSHALINTAHVRAIGFDFVFSPHGRPEAADPEKMRVGDLEFAKFLFKNPPVVLAASFSAGEFRASEGTLARRGLPLIATDPRPVGEIEPPEVTSFDTGRGNPPWSPPFVGLIDTLDGTTRTVPLWAPTNTRPFFHKALELARLYWGLPVGSIKAFDDRIELVRADGSVQARVPMRDKQLLDVNWFSPWISDQNPRASFVDVFLYADMLQSDKPEEKKSALDFFAQDSWRDAVVLIGPVSPLLQDVAPTPLDERPVPRVGVHGNLLKTIVSGIYLQRPTRWQSHAIVFALTTLIALLALAGGPKAIFAKIAAITGVAVYAFLTFEVFNAAHLVLPFIAPIGAALSTSFVGLIWQIVDEQKQKGRIKGMFGAYVSPQLVNRMVESHEDPQLGGHDAEITAYFSDIQGFSTFSEKLKSGPLVELMNEYLTACTDIVQEEGGTLDKYIGDAVVAMFGAPIPMTDHAFRACVATQRVHLKLGELREKWKSEGDKWPDIVWRMQSRIGLNTGECMIGNMGSRTRFNYTMMGDNVNLAARMESGAKQWGAYTMCAEATKTACEKHGGDRIVFRPLGRIVVKGRTLAVPIYEIVGLKETVTDRTRECIALFAQAMEKYYARDWDGALALFAQSRELEFNIPGKTPGVASNPSLVYLEITEQFKHEPPPEKWDGVYHMKEK